MMRVRTVRQCAVTLSILGLLTGQLAQAAAPVTVSGAKQPATSPVAAAVSDVELRADGSLIGQMLDAQGTPELDVPVVLHRSGQVAASTRTDEKGQFLMKGISPGAYVIETAHGRGACRVWASQTAPPSAQQGILLVSGQQVVRGQQPRQWANVLGGALANPWVLAFIVAAAIAIPLAIDNDDAS